MHWNSFSEFLSMGGKGLYVWSSFGVAALCFILEPFFLTRQRRNTLARLVRQWRAEQQEQETP